MNLVYHLKNYPLNSFRPKNYANMKREVGLIVVTTGSTVNVTVSASSIEASG
jgi:hypothetical protein